MCTYIVEQAAIAGSVKGPNGWMAVDIANVSYDHPVHAPFDHALMIDFVRKAGAPGDRVAVELDTDSARALVVSILAALASGEAEHATGS